MGARRNNGRKTSPETAAAKIKAAKAMELRMEGKTFQAIADEAGYNSPQAAYDAVKRSLLAVIQEPAEELIRIELERLDVLWGIQYLNAQAGDVQAMAACMRLMERRAKLLGLDAPVKQDVKTEVTTKSGVLMVPAAVDPQSWAEAAAKQQAALSADAE
ncbi:MAG TPA: hypothetical protein VFP92_10795 [Rhodanobacteraceae bacterium]|nr:hypothetical protein [Rhodanobacteraceae bacterium]